MPVIHARDTRRHATPNAVMSTLASPSLGSAELSLWRVVMTAGQRGPEHTFDVEQVWTVLDGAADVEINGETHGVAPGDTLVLPANVIRQIAAGHGGFEALVAARAGARAALADGTDKGTPAWIA
ncbi:MAG TPA: cupin domain-containing protein [Solirubrobacteraceae bacterium]|nr:cupin domain-containing protein [Solirubrobacteraceae bacterium]